MCLLTSTFMQVVLQHEALVLALGYEMPEHGANTCGRGVVDVAAAFVQLMVELSLEVLVDNMDDACHRLIFAMCLLRLVRV